MAEIQLTQAQQAAVDNRGGSLLVSAAAGSGKTKVLVERLFAYMERERCDVDDFLIITYTKAAAAELRGKIAFADPSVSGSSYTGLVTMLYALSEEEQDAVLQRFAENLDGKLLSGSGEIVSSVASGESLAGITLEETALKRIAAGDEIEMIYPTDGTSCVPDGTAIVSGAPHPDNAKAFVDFTVSRDVQELIQERFYRRSVRSDVEPASKLPPLKQLTQVDYDVGWASAHRDAILMSWAFYLDTEPES